MLNVKKGFPKTGGATVCEAPLLGKLNMWTDNLFHSTFEALQYVFRT